MYTIYMLTRRSFLQLGLAGSSLLLTRCSAQSLPLRQSSFPSLEEGAAYTGLATSLYQDYAYDAEVEGHLPRELVGTLFRNGPGLFDRGDMRKRALLDGDGLVQAFRFNGSTVAFQSRFVRTQKYEAEERAGRFLYPTLSTQAPGGLWANIFAADEIRVQAGVTVLQWQDKLYAFDEHMAPYALTPDTLETIGPDLLGLQPDQAFFSAHWKIDGRTGEWLHFGFEYGPFPKIHFVIFDKQGRLKSHRKTPLPRFVYVHDYFVSQRYQIINLQPLYVAFWGFLFGMRSMADSLRWRPARGSLLLLAPRDGSEDYIRIETDPAFFWHTINAYEQGDEIIADFVGYSNPDHFAGKNPVILALMQGKQGEYRYPGQIRRYIIQPKRGKARQEILHAGNYEWPFMNLGLRCYPYRICYAASPRPGEFFWSKVCRIDVTTGKEQVYAFPEGVYCSEPVFVPKPGHVSNPANAEDPGWLLTEGYHGGRKKSFLAVFNEDHVADGPVAQVWLRHHVPFSFHGWWQPA